MKFNRDPDGIFFFAICHLVFLGQIIFIAYIDDEYIKYNQYNEKIICQNPYLIFNKAIIYALIFLSFISHVKTAITNPGYISYKNNMNIIQFYYYIHEPLIKNAIRITEKQTPEAIRKIIFEANNIKYDENENYSLDNDEDFINDSDVDEKKFSKKTSISEQYKKAMIRTYRLKLTRCKSCYVARPVNAHHCGICHSCILEKDHHCPWVNNCVGLFNKKFFILYLFYALLSVIYSVIIFFYFILYKHLNIFLDDIMYIVFGVLFIIIGIIYGAFVTVLLCEQYDNIKHDCTLIDYNSGILMEKSSFKQQLIIIFGDNFSLKWLIPLYSGGNYNMFLKICKLIENDKEQNEIKFDKYGNKKEKLE